MLLCLLANLLDVYMHDQLTSHETFQETYNKMSSHSLQCISSCPSRVSVLIHKYNGVRMEKAIKRQCCGVMGESKGLWVK